MKIKVRLFSGMYIVLVLLGIVSIWLYFADLPIYRTEDYTAFKNSICCMGILMFIFTGVSFFSNYKKKQRYLRLFANGDCVECKIKERRILYDSVLDEVPVCCYYICEGRDIFGELHTFKSHIFPFEDADMIAGLLDSDIVKVYMNSENNEDYFIDIPILVE